MKIEFIAYNGKNKMSANTANEAAAKFLAEFKNRTFSVAEYRNGSAIRTICGDQSKDTFYISFKSRKEAQQFIDKAVNINDTIVANSAAE
jgi:hypothetical protein